MQIQKQNLERANNLIKVTKMMTEPEFKPKMQVSNCSNQFYELNSSVFFSFRSKVKSLSQVQLFATQWQASPSMGCSRQENWSGLPFPSPFSFKANYNIIPGKRSLPRVCTVLSLNSITSLSSKIARWQKSYILLNKQDKRRCKGLNASIYIKKFTCILRNT